MRKDRRSPQPLRKERIPNLINRQIQSEKVRIVNKEDYEEWIDEVITLDEALALGRDLEVDLIEIAVNQKEGTSICKLMALDKFAYQEKKKAKEAKKNQKTSEIKEIRFSADIGENDYQTKLRHAREFLQDGDGVKSFVQFRGRQNFMPQVKETGKILLLRFADDLSDVGKVIEMPNLVGNKMFIRIAPKKQ